jgi:hypothetical protein
MGVDFFAVLGDLTLDLPMLVLLAFLEQTLVKFQTLHLMQQIGRTGFRAC